MKNGFTTQEPKEEEIMGTTWPCFNIDSQAEHSWEKAHVVYLVGSARLVYYELLKPNETITGALYRTQLMRLSRALKEKRAHYYARHDKVILLHDNARPHVAAPVKTYLETLNWEVLPHPPYSPDIAPSDYYLFRSMAHGHKQHFTSYEDTKNWVDSWIASKDKAFFDAISVCCQKDGKK